MKRLRWGVVLLLHFVLAGVAASPLDDMTCAIEALGRYEVQFIVRIQGQAEATNGYYRVDGDQYYLSIAAQEIYGNAAMRATISHYQQEVVLESVVGDGAQLLLISNPAAAFTKLAGEFDIQQVEAQEEATTIELRPKSEDSILESSQLEIDNATKLPRSISYKAEGDTIDIIILDITSTEDLITPEYPADYEVIDIR